MLIDTTCCSAEEITLNYHVARFRSGWSSGLLRSTAVTRSFRNLPLLRFHGLVVVPMRAYSVGMNSSSTVTPAEAKRRERDRNLVARVLCAPAESTAMSRELFFEHFERIEKRLQRRLRDRGLKYDEGCDYYNSIIDRIYERVYAPNSLKKAVEDFDADQGPLVAWLLGRVVFAIRDWLKTSQATPSRLFQTDSEPLADDSLTEPQSPNDFVLARALHRMTAAQRACTVLRLFPARPLIADDLVAIAEASRRISEELKNDIAELLNQYEGRKDSEEIGEDERDAIAEEFRRISEELKNDIAELLNQHEGQKDSEETGEDESNDTRENDESIGIREKNLTGELAIWHSKRSHQQRLYRRYRHELLASGTTENELAELEQRAGRRTQEEILAHYNVSTQEYGESQDCQQARLRFEYCCHEIIRCERRLENLTTEYAGAPSVDLLSYVVIAAILGSTVEKVTAHLNRARKHIEEEEN